MSTLRKSVQNPSEGNSQCTGQSSIQSTQMQRAYDILNQTFGYSEFRPSQAEIIETIIRGDNALVLMPTGGGKSLCYQIPALVRDGVAIVVSPLIALMQDQVSALQLLGIKAAFLNSTLDYHTQYQVEQDVLQQNIDILYIAPERLLSPNCIHLLERAHIALFAIDEAHCVSQWGHDFRPEYQRLSMLAERFANVPRIALTATADERTRQEMKQQLSLQDAAFFINSFDRPNIYYHIAEAHNAKNDLLRFIKSKHTHEKDGAVVSDAGIVYCLSRKKVDVTAQWLSEKGLKALPYHAGLSTDVRAENQRRFLQEESIIIVATIAFGMGIDKPNVRFVAHLSLPKNIEAYYQETGRAGRDGLPSNAWMSYGFQDIVTMRQMMQDSKGSEQYKLVIQGKLNSLLGLCESASCRRKILLEYFSETTDDKSCGNCDNCLYPPKTWDATIAVQKALSTVHRTGHMFGVNYLVDVLRGSKNARVLENGHDKLSTYGIGDDVSTQEWKSLFRQLVAENKVLINAEQHGALQLTESSRALLKGEETFIARKYIASVKSYSSSSVDSSKSSVGLQDQALFDALKALRKEIADENDLPAYIVFTDKTLQELARQRPIDNTAFRYIHGVGESKLNKYGQRFMQEIAQHKLPDILNNGLSDTINETLGLYLQNKTPEEIATARALKTQTIYGHFAEAIAGNLLKCEDILTLADDQIQEIHQAAQALDITPESSIKPLHEHFEGEFDYGVLKCVVSSI